MMRFMALGAIAFLVGCSMLPGPRATHFHVEPGWEKRLEDAVVVLGNVTVQANVNEDDVRDHAEYVYSLLLGEINAPRRTNRPAANTRHLTLNVFIRQSTFVSGFETTNAVCVESRIRDDEALVAFGLYSEETLETVASYRYLHDLIEVSLGEVFR